MYKKITFILLYSSISIFDQEKGSILFYDDYEGYKTNNITLRGWQTEGIVKLSKEKKYEGEHSLKFISGEGYENRAFANISSFFPIESNSFYGSMMLYIEEASPDGIHWTMIQGSGKIKNTNHKAEIRYGGQHNKKLMANYDTQGIKSDCWQHSDLKIPEAKWTKYKWFFNSQTNTMKLWVNDELIDELTVRNEGSGCVNNETNNKWLFPIFDTQTIGWVDYQKKGGKRTLWIDNVKFWTE